jgi:hypothetical protein
MKNRSMELETGEGDDIDGQWFRNKIKGLDTIESGEEHDTVARSILEWNG